MSQYLFGVDIGGTTVKIGLFSENTELLDSWEIPTAKDNQGSRILPDIADSIQEKLRVLSINRESIIGVGVGVPGPVDEEGNVHGAVNLGWNTVKVAEDMNRLLRVPVKVGNDANLAALGEMVKGAGQGCRNLVAVTLGTGVGGGIIVNGNLLIGANGAAGEIGHIPVEENEIELCGCKNRGCLEQYSSATGVVRLVKKKLYKTDKASVLREMKDISAKGVFDAAKAGDEIAVEVLGMFGCYLGKALASIACVTNPELIVIGGGVAKAGEMLIDYIRPYFIKYAFSKCSNVKFALAKLGNDAGIYGAAGLFRKE